MTTLCCEVLQRLTGKWLVTAESLTGGGIGAAITAIPGSSSVYKGGIISYTNGVKEQILGVRGDTLTRYGAVSQQTAREMACGVRRLLNADVAISVTGLAGPGGDEYGHTVGTVFIGFDSDAVSTVREYHFFGDRETVRDQTIRSALELILELTSE